MKPISVHFKNSNLRRISKPVFHRTQHSIRFIFITLKINNSINHMFQNLWTGNISLFCNMTDNDYGNIFGFGNVHQKICAFPNLRNTTRRTCYILRINSLNTVYYNYIRHNFFNLRFNTFH